jgi:hypothetical protein
MKLGLFLLVIGLVIAGMGVALWQYGESRANLILLLQDMFLEPNFPFSYARAQMMKAIGIGLLVPGGGLILGGFVTILKK